MEIMDRGNTGKAKILTHLFMKNSLHPRYKIHRHFLNLQKCSFA